MFAFFFCFNLLASELYIGTSTADITPALPVALAGQFDMRIAVTAETPLKANVVVIESREGSKSLDVTIMVSCDLVYISAQILAMVRQETAKRLPDLDVNKIILNATHTHTAPVLEDGNDASFLYPIPKEGVTQVKTYRAFFTQHVVEAVVKAWQSRSAGSVGWGLSRSAVGYNRRAVYANKTTVMYGKTDLPEFRSLEGYEDHDINSLFFWNAAGKLIAVSVDVA